MKNKQEIELYLAKLLKIRDLIEINIEPNFFFWREITYKIDVLQWVLYGD